MFSDTKAFLVSNPVLSNETLNRWGLHEFRSRLAHRLADARRRRMSGFARSHDRDALARDGLVVREDFLPTDAFARLATELASFRGAAREFQEGDAITRRIPLSPRNLRRLPETAALVRSSEFQGLLRYVASFDAAPTLCLQTVFSRADAGAPRDPQTNLHMDTFHPTMKAWFLLQDVADADGPFTYVRGSHAATERKLAWQRRRSVDACRGEATRGGAFRATVETLEELGMSSPSRCAYRANTLIVADTSGFHARGITQRPSMRVEIFASQRRNPFLPWCSFDVWGLPFLRDRQTELLWWWHDLPIGRDDVEPTYRPIGERRADDPL